MKVDKVVWFSYWGQSIGILLAHDEKTCEKKAYIGVGGGADEERDVKTISRMGAKFPLDVARELYEHLCLDAPEQIENKTEEKK